MRTIAALLTLAVVAGAPTCAAADPPDLAGAWTLQPGPDAGAAAGFCYLTCTITEKPDVISVWARGRMTAYKLDGSEARTTTRNGGTAIEIVTTAAWSGSSVVITQRAHTINGDNREATATMTISRRGAEMVVDYRGAGPNAKSATARAVYRHSGA
jgi:hypothetical protein